MIIRRFGSVCQTMKKVHAVRISFNCYIGPTAINLSCTVSECPHGTPICLTVDPGTDTDEITALLDRADAIGQHYAAHGWAFASTKPSTPGAAELAAGPSFAGYPCSPTVDANGLPTWIIVDGKHAPVALAAARSHVADA